jgi:HEAT repeat protein
LRTEVDQVITDLSVHGSLPHEVVYAKLESLTPTEMLYVASILRRAPEALVRRAVADRLGGLGLPQEYAFVDESIDLLLQMLSDESVTEVTAEIVHSLGCRMSRRATPALCISASAAECEVRKAVAQVISFTIDDDNCDEVVAALITLSEDEDDEVREWATLALGSQLFYEDDCSVIVSKKIRSALIERSSDTNADVRGEALVGLALRADPEVGRLLDTELSGFSVSESSVKAAKILGARPLCTRLVALRTWWSGDIGLLDQAISACCG